MCGTACGRFRRVDGDAHQLRAGYRELLDLDRRPDGVDGVGVRHRLHTHRRVASDRDGVCAPAHGRLARTPGGRAGGVDVGVERRADNAHGQLVIISGRGAPHCRAGCTAPGSNALPRNDSCVAVALPIVMRSGVAPSRPTASPGCTTRDSSVWARGRPALRSTTRRRCGLAARRSAVWPSHRRRPHPASPAAPSAPSRPPPTQPVPGRARAREPPAHSPPVSPRPPPSGHHGAHRRRRRCGRRRWGDARKVQPAGRQEVDDGGSDDQHQRCPQRRRSEHRPVAPTAPGRGGAGTAR